MKTKYSIICVLLALLSVASCQKPEYIYSNAQRQGLTSIEVVFPSGKYADKVLTRYVIEDDTQERYEIPLPWYYPETSDDITLPYLTRLRLRAKLEPNFSISPKLGIVDLTEDNWYTFTDPKGNSRRICITGKRVKSSDCSLASLLIEDVMVDCVIYEEEGRILIPYLEDLSSVSVSGQVSPHASIFKVGGKSYREGGKYNLNTGSSVTLMAPDETTTKTYTVEQGVPELLDMGLNKNSVKALFDLDPKDIGLPLYTEPAFVSIAALENKLVVCLGNGNAPKYFNGFNGVAQGNINLGSAKADVITNDEMGHLLLASYALGGNDAQTVNIYSTSSVTAAPTLIHSFLNPVDCPIGHRMKVIGDVTKDAVIVFTSEGIAGVTNATKAVSIAVKNGIFAEPVVKDFNGLGLNWGPAPVHFATVVPASLNPELDGYFLDYYDNNADADIAAADTGADAYILHHITGKGADERSALVGNWANNPNCLDIKTFNDARYMSLFVVSHFPQWGTAPRVYLYDVTDPSGTLPVVFSNKTIAWFQQGAIADDGAAGDVALAPTTDGYRMYLYYYDHHAHAVGAYVVDCIKK